MRWWFAIAQGWAHRKRLKSFLTDPEKRIKALEEITPERLDKANIAILVLDFDGVLAGHDAPQPLPEVTKWLTNLSQNIGEQRIAILTNKPKAVRIAYFAKHFPSIAFIYGVKKKPYPDGLLEIANYKGVPPHRLALVDDRLLTGMLATCVAYTQGWYFCNPYHQYRRHFFKEVFFSVLRGLERLALRALAPTCRG